MTRVVAVGASRVDLDGVDPLAIGGEASVYAVGAHAVKVWHVPTPARRHKLEALLARRDALPDAVVAPDERVHDVSSGDVVGFSMPLLAPSYEPIAMLGRAGQRAAHGLSNRVALELLARLLEALLALHRAGIVVGDLSDQNVAIDAGSGVPVRLLDVDSFQIDGHACEVATEAFLDPHLYGPDAARPCVTAGGQPRMFSPLSDGYAFAVLLFRSLTGAHPYGGALDALPTLPRRALAGASILQDDVRSPPRVRDAIDVLGAPLRSRFAAIFDRGDRAPFAVRDLADHAASLVACGCGLEVPASILPCPRCVARAQVSVPTGRPPGGLRAAVVLEAGGPIVAVAAAGDAILAVAIEAALPFLYVARGGRIERFALCNDAAPSGWDVALGSSIVAVAPRGSDATATLHVAAVTPRAITTVVTASDRARSAAAVAVAHDIVFRLARGTVLAGRIVGGALVERPVATVVRGGVRLFGAALGDVAGAIALGTVLGAPRWEIVTIRGATTLDAPPLAPGETLREVAAYGDAEGALVLARTRISGRSLVRAIRFDLAGRRVAERTVPDDARAADDVVSGGAFRGGAVVLATAGGLVREDASGAEHRFAATAAYTAASAAVALAPGGVLVADGRVVRRITPS